MFLEIDNLTMRFAGIMALDSVHLVIQKGEIISLIGPNGAGKTTLFNCISGFYRPTKGRVTFLEEDVTQLPAHSLAKKGIARTFQNLELFNSLSVIDNLLVGSHVHIQGHIFAEALRNSKILKEEKKAQKKAQDILQYLGLTEVQNQRVSSLPLGYQKLVELGRALAVAPKLLLLDEPAAGMNEQETKRLMDLIRAIQREWDVTILLIEHDMSVVMSISSRVYVLHYGKKIAEGAPEIIRKDPAVIEAYLGDEQSA